MSRQQLSIGYRAVWILAVLVGCDNGAQLPGQGGGAGDGVGVQVDSVSLGASPDTSCSTFDFGGKKYWFCTNDRNWQTARTKCQGVSFDLAAFESSAENAFVKSHLSADAWGGGSDSAVEGAWRWAFSGQQFWQGAAGGSAVGGSFTNWKSGQPDSTSQDCLQMAKIDGKWSDESCTLVRDYVCEGDNCPSDPNKTDPGQCGCGVPDTDSDSDGVANCVDGCPNDAGKHAPGTCGCGVSDHDADLDGTPDCNDDCPTDARFVVPGDCGCGDAPASAGTACNDGLCAASTTCDGHGFCGNPTSCKPDTSCTLKYFHTSAYWFCSTTRNFDLARQKCQAVNMDLAALETAEEDDFAMANSSTHTWVGASDKVVEGDWYWLGTGQQFWTGGEAGHAVGGLYTNWEAGEPDDTPASEDCAVIDPDGTIDWEVKDCNLGRKYICERVDACPNDPDKLRPEQCGCGIPETDSDGDHVPDCKDLCRDDAAKSAPGTCGCGQSDADGDADGIANCVDECPLSNDRTAGGTCGCPGAATAAGTACYDGACGPGVCDGAGHCGAAPATCSPDPACGCTFVRINGNGYWSCTCTKTRAAAQAACALQPGRQLLQISTPSENAFVASRITGNTWLGANDLGVEGEWRWQTRAHGDAGPRFWDGAVSGEPHFGRYTNWMAAEPGGGANSDCAAMSFAAATRGQWLDQSCTATANLACELGLQRLDSGPIPLPRPCETLGQSCADNLDEANCVPAAQAFPELAPGDSLNECTECVQQFRDCTACVNAVSAGGGDPAVLCTAPWPNPGDPVPCSGSAAPPPPGSTCGSFLDGLPANHEFVCTLKAVNSGSGQAPYPGTGVISSVEFCELDNAVCSSGDCGLVFSCSTCADGAICPCSAETDPDDAQCPGADNQCVSRKVCGTLIDECPTLDVEGDVPCQEVDLCPADTLEEDGDQTFETVDDESALTPIPTTAIATDFGAPDVPSNANKVPDDPACPGAADPENCPANENHRWCHYDTPDEVSRREVLPPARDSNAGKPGAVEFFFTPNIDYHYDTFPGPLGLVQFDVGARASLEAGAEVHVLRANKRLEVIDFVLEAKGGLHDAPDGDPMYSDICGVSTADSQLLILERFDLLPMKFQQPLPDEAFQKDCIDALHEFQEAVNKVKKAYNDAKELLRQHDDLKAVGSNFGVGLDGLCDQILSDLPFDFPISIDCLNLRPEEILNAFIDYYRNLAINKLGNEVATRVADTIDVAFDQTKLGIDLANIKNTEEITLVTAQFFIGPIPANLQVLFTASYGIEIDGIAKFQPSSLVRTLLVQGRVSAGADDPFAYVGAKATPYAGAGIALFVGVGFDFGIAAAKIGIEGSVSLGRIGLPIEGGAGIAVSAEPDTRALSNDSDPDYVAVKDPPLIPLKKYSIQAVYKYGGMLKLEDILSGQIDVAVKIKFLFFSKKFRARIARFSGFCTPEKPKPFCKIDLFGGYGTFASIPFESVDWGKVLMPSAFLPLKRFEPKDYRAAGSQRFMPGRAAELFYDNLCSCIPRFEDIPSGTEGAACERSADCCGYESGDFCFTDPADSDAKCTDCRARGESCTSTADCCAGENPSIRCYDNPSDSLSYGTCQPKAVCLQPCSVDDDCDDTTGDGNLFCYTPSEGPSYCESVNENTPCQVIPE